VKPEQLMAPYVREGMTVLEPGPGMGFFTLPMATLVGSTGRVIAVDVQARMLEGLRRRAARAGLSERIDARLGAADSMGIGDLRGTVDFVLAVAVVHEMPSARKFFLEAADALKVGGSIMLSEPGGHVIADGFEKELEAAEAAGLQLVTRQTLRGSMRAVLKRLEQNCQTIRHE
jgi:tRNA A58 N-methylase Trm61